MANNELTFDNLVNSIQQVHKHLAAQAGRAVNISLTLRNWVIGFHIREYEQNEADRAKYGENLFAKLSQRLKKELLSFIIRVIYAGAESSIARTLRFGGHCPPNSITLYLTQFGNH
jgi:hypothetical protein